MLVGGTQASARLISQQALNAMTMREALTPPTVFMPRKFVPVAYGVNVQNFAHFVSPMVHPTTGETIVRMSDCVQGIEPCECKGKGYQLVGNRVFRLGSIKELRKE